MGITVSQIPQLKQVETAEEENPEENNLKMKSRSSVLESGICITAKEETQNKIFIFLVKICPDTCIVLQSQMHKHPLL